MAQSYVTVDQIVNDFVLTMEFDDYANSGQYTATGGILQSQTVSLDSSVGIVDFADLSMFHPIY